MLVGGSHLCRSLHCNVHFCRSCAVQRQLPFWTRVVVHCEGCGPSPRQVAAFQEGRSRGEGVWSTWVGSSTGTLPFGGQPGSGRRTIAAARRSVSEVQGARALRNQVNATRSPIRGSGDPSGHQVVRGLVDSEDSAVALIALIERAAIVPSQVGDVVYCRKSTLEPL
jgi:hypothetical protein